MSTAKNSSHIKLNLIPKNNFESSQTGKIITWILGSFRLLVIIVEVVVISGFAARFMLDVRHSQLNEQIKRKLAVIQEYQQFEQDFRRIQKKQELFQTANSQEFKFSPIVSKIVAGIPPEVKLNSVKVDNNQIEIAGSSLKEDAIMQFLVNLQSNPEFDNLAINSLRSDQNSIFVDFDIKSTELTQTK
jgi:Tfp pilus assembly protein PilN